MGAAKDAFNVVYEGPLARAQRMQQITNIQQGVADIAGVQPFWPQASLLMDWEKTVRRVFEIRSIQDLLLDEDDFESMVQQMEQQKQQQGMMQMVAGGAEALGAAAPGLKVLREQAPQAAA